MQTAIFRRQFDGLPPKERRQIEYNLKRLSEEDLRGIPYYKGPLKHFRKYEIGDYRIILAYCPECFNKYRKIIHCKICFREIKDVISRIIVFYVYPRKKLYRNNKITVRDFEFLENPF